MYIKKPKCMNARTAAAGLTLLLVALLCTILCAYVINLVRNKTYKTECRQQADR